MGKTRELPRVFVGHRSCRSTQAPTDQPAVVVQKFIHQRLILGDRETIDRVALSASSSAIARRSAGSPSQSSVEGGDTGSGSVGTASSRATGDTPNRKER